MMKFRFSNRSRRRLRSVINTRVSISTKSARRKRNARSDFRDVSSLVLERAIALVGADYSALGVLDPKGGRISLVAFRAAPHATIESVQGLIEEHAQSLDLT